MTVAEAVAAFLVESGVRYAFGVGGHGNTPLMRLFCPINARAGCAWSACSMRPSQPTPPLP